MKHTPLPWSWDGPVWDYDKEEEAPWLVHEYGNSFDSVITGELSCSKENAEFIVRACNNHYKLLEALKDLMIDAGGGSKACGHDFTCNCAWDKAKEAIKEAEE